MRQALTVLPAGQTRAITIPLPIMVGIFCIVWSAAFAVAKIAIFDCPPLLLLTARFLVAGVLVIGGTALAGGPWTLSRRDIALFAMLGVANQALYLGLGYVGLRDISAGLSTLIASANPIVIAVLAVMLLGERMTWRKALGLLLGFGGVAFIVSHRLSIGIEGLQGILFTIAALLSLVGGTILFKLFAPKDGFWIGNGIQSLSAGVALLPFSLVFESPVDVVPSWRLLASMVYLTFVVSIFAYLLWFHILKVSGATAASSYHFLMPPLGMLFGWLLIGEHVAAWDMLGIIPVVLGIYLVTRPTADRS
ncbi:MAG TPA: DMT family transporter [Pseudolabrys sp.]|nr:DMT family transporter [Pseudolabrys sp.]